MAEEKTPFHVRVAEKIIDQLREGTAPWQKPWKPGQESILPVNPTTGKRYRGVNVVNLISEGHADNRWLTYKQAAAAGAQVRKGEHGTLVQYWKFEEEQALRDAQGKPIKDAEGKALTARVELERPRAFYAVVFNAEQIDGMPPRAVVPPPEWNPQERAETILANSGVPITESPGNRAFYRPSTDSITLPERGQFPSADNFYATALHELSHATGHPSRLGRDLAHPFGSEGYAKEELRAEIGSMILGDELQIGHDPEQHVAYVASWIKILEDDPMEIVRACSDAEKINRFVLAYEQQQEQVQEQPMQTQGPTDEDRANALNYPVGVVLADPRNDFSMYFAHDQSSGSKRQTLAEALQSNGFNRLTDVVGEKSRDYIEMYAEASENLSRMYGIAPNSTGEGAEWGAYLERKGLASAFAERAEELVDSFTRQRQQGDQTQVADQDAPPQQAALERTNIAVPYKEKNEAKELGAKWDRQEKTWYVPAGADLAAFAKWTEPAAQTVEPVAEAEIAPAIIADAEQRLPEAAELAPGLQPEDKAVLAEIDHIHRTIDFAEGQQDYETVNERMEVLHSTIVEAASRPTIAAALESQGQDAASLAAMTPVAANEALMHALDPQARDRELADLGAMADMEDDAAAPRLTDADMATIAGLREADEEVLFTRHSGANASSSNIAERDRRLEEALANPRIAGALTAIGESPDAMRQHAVEGTDRLSNALFQVRAAESIERSEDRSKQPTRQYLAVPFGDKDKAKQAGARWDKAEKSWYAPAGSDPAKFTAWKPDAGKAQQDPAMKPEVEFAAAMREMGLTVPHGHPIMDGSRQRVPTNDDRGKERSGFYFAYAGPQDGHPAGFIKDNRSQQELRWASTGQHMTDAQRAEGNAQAAQRRQEREAELARTFEATAQRVQQQAEGLTPVAAPLPYHVAKGIEPTAGVMTNGRDGTLHLPAIDTSGKHWTTQYIQEDGTKRFAKDSQKEGHFHVVNGGRSGQEAMAALERAPAIVIAEGYATATTASEIVNHATVSAFDSGNLPAVAKALHERFPDKPIVILGENDLKVEAKHGYNPGREKATQAAEAVGGTAIFPIFAPAEQTAESGLTDFNDLATKSQLGREGAERQVKAAMQTAQQTLTTPKRSIAIEETVRRTAGDGPDLDDGEPAQRRSARR